MNILIAAARAVIWTFIIQSRKCWEEELFLFPPPRKTKAAWCQQWQICGSWVRIDMSCSCNQSLSKLAAVPVSWGDCDSSRGREVIRKSRADGTSGLKEKKKKTPWWEMLASDICSAVTQLGKYVCSYNSWHDMQYSEGRELIPVPSLDGREPPGIIIC